MTCDTCLLLFRSLDRDKARGNGVTPSLRVRGQKSLRPVEGDVTQTASERHPGQVAFVEGPRGLCGRATFRIAQGTLVRTASPPTSGQSGNLHVQTPRNPPL